MSIKFKRLKRLQIIYRLKDGKKRKQKKRIKIRKNKKK